MSVVQRHLFAVVDQPRVLEAELAFQTCLISDVSAEWWSECAHDVRRELHEERHEEETFATDTAGQRVVVHDHIQYRFRKVGVQFR